MDYKFRAQGSDRRRYVRLPIPCVVKCEEFSFDKSASAANEPIDVKDLSAGGLLLRTQKQYQIGEVLRVELCLPGWERYKPEFIKPDSPQEAKNTLIALAAVVRVEILADEDYEIGIRLTGIDDGHRLALERFIFETVKEKKRAEQDV